MLIQLPNGLIDGGDLFNYADVDELRGKQQNYLVDKDLVVGNIGHVPKILEDMILSLQTKEGLQWKGLISEGIYKLPSGDIETVLIKVRENTYGPRYYHAAQCTKCKHVNKDLRLDLDKLELDAMSIEDMLKPKELKLPKSKLLLVLKPAYLKDMFKLVKIAKEDTSSIVTSLMAISVKNVGYPVEGKKSEYEIKQDIKKEDIDYIPASDLLYIQDKIKDIKLEGTIDTTVIVDCVKCKEEFEFELNVFDPDFFSHTRGS